MIDLRSDTVTKPSDGMRRAIADAEVGDDVYGEDPTVAELQERVAAMFGHEAALFTPTGSMANVLALAALAGPGREVLCESRAHILRAELGAHGALTGLTSRTWIDSQGQIDLEAIREMHAPDMGPFFVRTTTISVENTHNFAGGTVLPLADLVELRGSPTRSVARSTWTAPGSGTPMSPTTSRWRRTAPSRTRCASASRRGSARRSAR